VKVLTGHFGDESFQAIDCQLPTENKETK